jgi:hypothetical protein
MLLSLVATIPNTGATNRAWENQRRAVRLVLFVAWTAAQDLLLQAKHLFVAAILTAHTPPRPRLQEIAQAGSPRAGQGMMCRIGMAPPRAGACVGGPDLHAPPIP